MALSNTLTLLVIWTLLHLHFLPTLALPATNTPSTTPDTIYDVAIIGGGPAGLAAAMSLGRVGRSAILIDSAVYRNAPTHAMHDIPTLDGTPPSVFRALARQQISAYPSVILTNGTVTAIEPPSSSTNSTHPPTFLLITTAPPNNTSSHSARRIILATGMSDILPPTPGLASQWGKKVFWCTWCDGWEHRLKPYAASLGTFSAGGINASVANAEGLNGAGGSWMLTNGTATGAARERVFGGWEGRLERWGVVLEDGVIGGFEDVGSTRSEKGRRGARGGADVLAGEDGEGDGGLRVRFTDGRSVVVNGIKASFPAELQSRDLLAEGLGLRLGAAKGEKEVKVLVDGDMKASSTTAGAGAGANGGTDGDGEERGMMEGVYAVGDMNSDGSSNVVHALWSAKRAVVAIHGELGREIADEAAVADAEKAAGGGKGMRKREGAEVQVVEDTWEGERKRLAARSGGEEMVVRGMAVEEMVRYVNE